MKNKQIILEISTQNILGIEVDCLSYSITFNEHVLCYQTAHEYYNKEIYECDNLDLEQDIYCLNLYDRTPVGFYTFIANTLEGLKEQLSKFKKEKRCRA